MINFSMAQLESIGEVISAGVVIIGKENGKILYVNNRALQLFGVDPRGLEMPEHSTKLMKLLTLEGNLYPPEKLPASQALFDGTEAKDELIIERPNGSRVVVAASAKPIRDEKGSIIAAIGIFEDITERKVFEQQVEEERETLSGIIESTETMIAYLDLDFNFLIVNSAYAKASGYSIDELIGKNHFELFPNKENQAIFMKVRDTGKSVKFLDKPFEFANRPERGVTYWDWTLTPAKNEEGNVIGLVLTLMETTERKKAEDALRVSEERFRLVAEAANVLVYELNVENGIAEVIRGEEVLGYEKGEMPSANDWWVNQIHPDDKAIAQSKLEKAMHDGISIMIEYRVRRKQGDYIIVHDTVNMVLNEQGKVIRLVGGVRDVTERKRAEEALAASERKFRTIVELAGEGIVIAKPEGNYTFVNNKMAQMLGYPIEEILGKSSTDFMFEEDQRKQVMQVRKELPRGGTLYGEFKFRRKDGSALWTAYNASPLFDEKGQHIGNMVMHNDITDRKLLQAKLEQYAKDLEKTVEERTKQLKDKERLAAIGETAGMVGHDIRNPLQAMMCDVYLLKGCLESMSEMPVKRDVAESLDSLESNISYVNKIVADLQDYARPLKPEYTEVWLKELINGVWATVALPRNIKLSVDVEEFRLITEPTFMKRALTNLVTNAIQAMPEGGELGITAKRKENSVIITVSDTGKGIPEDVKPLMFKPLMTTKAKGQGLGLAVVKRLVEGLNGKISFESKEGKGTKFIIELPLKA